MEEGLPEETIVRVASNGGVPESTLYQLQQILDALSDISNTGNLPSLFGRL